jgi:hypothetical protein
MELEAWHDFHVITGGSAATLVGLIFVVISIGPQIGARNPEDIRAFVSPTVGFFSAVLLLSALMVMPRLPPPVRGIGVAILGFGGTTRLVLAHVPARLQPHHLGPEDLVCYFVIPLLSQLAVIVAGVTMIVGSTVGPAIVGYAIVALLAVSLRNAWDLVIYTARRSVKEKG